MKKLSKLSIIFSLCCIATCQTSNVIKSVKNTIFWDGIIILESMEATSYSYNFHNGKYTLNTKRNKSQKFENCILESGNYRKEKNILILDPKKKLCLDLGISGDPRRIVPYNLIGCNDEGAIYVSKDTLSQSRIEDLGFRHRSLNLKYKEGTISLTDTIRQRRFILK